ncbi:coiled-coil domain-containing protein 113 [Selaginella moellendorffii]|uniref:coiled-coil domain-containing protein 113 n=1 Tax=Selaginella moellendorffii TaxID=88036 RepID=UPI000D1C4167|nr:coiled-coil domain-containing protein 113 [Selaginella moellendorffii]XP_024527069.1 coiled-coil domain-containing protein 113 [Selaginella moellendorffii]XP_024527074.1 coiled-coil domain-containing protein 113 [Selaginella moellendorffii]|eukprot:XP_024527062.1 coiled-coil domain-containing protein 113 [Selaginella moellendorffii]
MDNLEVEERIRELKALQMRQDLVRVENTMLTEHLARVVVSWKGSMELHLEKAAEERENNGSDSTSRSSLSSRGSSPSSARSTVRFTAAAGPAVAPEAPVPMSMEEKCEIAEEECRFLEQHLDKMRSENERVLDDYRAILKEAKMAIAEVRKEKSDFYRDVLLLAQLNPANKSYSQDILSFIEEKLRKRVVVRNSIKAKNSSLQAEITELETQFASKKDLKDILHVVDFDQIKILNHELNSRTRERDNGIQSLKSVMKGSMKAMNETQKELTNAYDRGIELKNCLRDRVPVIKSAKDNIVTEKSQRMKLHEAVLTAIQDQDGPVQPTAMDYMRTQDKAGKLWKDIRRWEVKVEVATLMSQELEKSLAFMQGVSA